MEERQEREKAIESPSVSQEQHCSTSEYLHEEEEREWREEEPMEVEEEEEKEENEQNEECREDEISEVDGDMSREDPSIHLHSAEERRALAYLLSNASNANTLCSNDSHRDTSYSPQHSAHSPILTTQEEQQQLEDVQNQNVETSPQPEVTEPQSQPSPFAEAIRGTFQDTSIVQQLQDALQTTSQEPDDTPVPAVPPNTLPSSFEGNQAQSNLLTVSGTEGHLHVHLDNNPAFNTFNYWRIPIPLVELPIPKIEVDIDITGQTTNVCVKAKVQEKDDTYQSQVNLTMATDASSNHSITMASSSQDMPPSQHQPHNTIEVRTWLLVGNTGADIDFIAISNLP